MSRTDMDRPFIIRVCEEAGVAFDPLMLTDKSLCPDWEEWMKSRSHEGRAFSRRSTEQKCRTTQNRRTNDKKQLSKIHKEVYASKLVRDASDLTGIDEGIRTIYHGRLDRSIHLAVFNDWLLGDHLLIGGRPSFVLLFPMLGYPFTPSLKQKVGVKVAKPFFAATFPINGKKSLESS
jgi:hypothetical protein